MSNDPMGGLMGMLGGMQAKLEAAKAEAAKAEATGTAGGGAVTAVATGANQIVSVTISEVAFEDRELLEDLVVAACNEALRRAQEEAGAKLSEVASGILPPGMMPPGILPGT